MPLEYNLLGLSIREEDAAAVAAGRRDGVRGYPCPPFWQYARKWNNDAILGVDAHDPEALADEGLWHRGRRQLEDWGYTIIDHLNMEG